MLLTGRPQSQTTLPWLTLMIVSVGFLPSGCAGGKGGRRPPMPRRGEQKNTTVTLKRSLHKSLHKNEPAYPDKPNGCRLPHV